MVERKLDDVTEYRFERNFLTSEMCERFGPNVSMVEA